MASSGDWMAGGAGKRVAVRLFTIFLGLCGILCFAYPILSLVRDEGGLIDDTRAYFGAGTSAGVPTVSQISCSSRRYGTSSTRSPGSRSWICTLYITPAEPEAASPAVVDEPPANAGEPANDDGPTNEDATAQYKAQTRRWMEQQAREMERFDRETRLPDPAARTAGFPSSLERELPFHPGEQPPTLRRLSAEGEPLHFGIVWSGGALAWQWLHWAFFSIFFIAAGVACFYAVRVAWRRTRA